MPIKTHQKVELAPETMLDREDHWVRYGLTLTENWSDVREQVCTMIGRCCRAQSQPCF